MYMCAACKAVLFGGSASAYHPPPNDYRGRGQVGLVQDGWVACRAPAEVAHKVQRLRTGIDALVTAVSASEQPEPQTGSSYSCTRTTG
jgi:hypothetical protein